MRPLVLDQQKIAAAVIRKVNDKTKNDEIREEVANAIEAFQEGKWDDYAAVVGSLFETHQDTVDLAVATATPTNEPVNSFADSWRARNAVQLETFAHIDAIVSAQSAV
jgi:hypothetical protein